MAKADKKWESFEDAFRAIITDHKEFFELDKVEPGSSKVKSASGYFYDIEVLAYAKEDGRAVLFECRRKSTRNLEPKDAGEFAYRIETTGAANASQIGSNRARASATSGIPIERDGTRAPDLLPYLRRPTFARA